MKLLGGNIKKLCILFSIILITSIVFYPCLSANFINLDDGVHLLDNKLVYDLDFLNVLKIFKQKINRTYIPLTTLSFAIENHFFGLNPFVYHLNNLILHIIISLLIYVVALQLGFSIRCAFISTLIFSIHPMHVESVAWVTERKDVLYGCFYMMSLSLYLSYIDTKKRSFFICSVLCGLLSMISKPMALSLPLVLLLIDWYKRRDQSIIHLIKEKIWFALYIFPITLMTLSKNISVYENNSTIFESFLIGIWTFTFYLKKFFIPYKLHFSYQLPFPIEVANIEYFIGLMVMFLLILSLIKYRNNRIFVFAVVFYVFSIFFLIRFSFIDAMFWVADRFMYLPSVGFCILGGYVIDKQFYKKYVKVILVIMLLIFAMSTNQLTNAWNSSLLIWKDSINKSEGSETAFIYYGRALVGIGDVYEAREQHRLAKLKKIKKENYFKNKAKNEVINFDKLNINLAKNPDDVNLILKRADYLRDNKEESKAIENYKRAIELDPKNELALFSLANLYLSLENYDKAIGYYDILLEHNGKMVYAHHNRAKAYEAKGDLNKALELYYEIIEFEERFPYSYLQIGKILQNQNRMVEAIAYYNKTYEHNHTIAEQYYLRGKALYEIHSYKSALSELYYAEFLDYEVEESLIKEVEDAVLAQVKK